MTTGSREARGREREESFGLPMVEVVGISVLLVALLAAIFFFSLDILVALGILTAVGGTAKLIFRLRENDGDELPPASPAFRALADPARPLAGDAPISGGSVPRIDAAPGTTNSSR